MLELGPVGPSVAIAVALGAFTLDLRIPVSPEPAWHYGVIDARAYHTAAGIHRFTFHSQISETEEPTQLEVFYIGAFPPSVCPGLDATLEGVVEGGLFIASRVRGPGCTKGAECRRYDCLPTDQRPEECRPNQYE